MKSASTFTLDSEILEKLSKRKNKSEVVNRALLQFFKIEDKELKEKRAAWFQHFETRFKSKLRGFFLGNGREPTNEEKEKIKIEAEKEVIL
jgi:hypothetical protein